MISPDAPKGHVAVLADIRASGIGQGPTRGLLTRMPFGRALQSDHAHAFDANVARVPIDSAAVSSAPARSVLRESAGRLAAPARG